MEPLESYYNSDEEIAWGPITLSEIKGDLKRPVRKPNRRHTLPKDCQMAQRPISYEAIKYYCEDEANLCQEVSDKMNISPASTEYYTPNDSLRQDSKLEFLEKLSKVIDEPLSEFSAYASAVENTKTSALLNECSELNNRSTSVDDNLYTFTDNYNSNMDDTCSNFAKAILKRETNYDIANFHQTLVDNSVIPEDEVKDSPIKRFSSKKMSLSGNDNLSSLLDNAIFISDHEESSVISSNNSNVSLSSISSSVESDTDNSLNYSGEIKNEEEDCIYSKADLFQNKDAGIQGTSSTSSGASVELNGIQQSPETSHDSDKVLPTIMEKESLSTSPILIPLVDLTQFDDSNDSIRLNDTMEEMNRLLDQGLNYSMSDEESIIETTPLKRASTSNLKFTPSSIISHSISQKETISTPNDNERSSEKPMKTFSKIPALQKKQMTPSSVKRSPDGNFKVPSVVPRMKLAHPTSPRFSPSHLKNVVSPVGLYIKNSPHMVLKQKLPQRELPKIVTTKAAKQSSIKENIPDLPQVIYRPSKKQIVYSEKKIIIPPSLKGLNVKEPIVIGHKRHINQDLNKTEVRRKLLENDITNCSIDTSTSDSFKDISVLLEKQAFIK